MATVRCVGIAMLVHHELMLAHVGMSSANVASLELLCANAGAAWSGAHGDSREWN